MPGCKHELVAHDSKRRLTSLKQVANIKQLIRENPKGQILVCVHCNHAEVRKFPGQDDKMMREHNLKTK